MDRTEQIRNAILAICIGILLPVTLWFGLDVFIKIPENLAFRDPAQEYYGRMRLIVADAVGLAAIVVGAFINIPFIGAGFILGGTFCLLIGYASYFFWMSNMIRFVSLLAALILLIIIGIWFAQKKK